MNFSNHNFSTNQRRKFIVIMAVKLILIRHGESESNAQGKFSGFQDVDLTERGVWQAERLAYRLREQPVDAVYCSDLKRAKHTAEIVFKNRGIEIIPNSEFREINFGAWEGFTWEEVRAKKGKHLEFRSWWESIRVETNLPQGESLVDLNNRVTARLNQILKKYEGRDKDQTIGLVSHGGTIRVILGSALNLPLKYVWYIEQYSTALNIVNYYSERASVALLNDTSHLEDWWENGLKNNYNVVRGEEEKK